MKKLLPFLALALFATQLTTPAHAAKAKPPKGFVALYDGESFDGWSFIPSEPQYAWKVDPKSGTLGRSIQGGSIWTDDTYGDFVLQLEFKLSRDCNSGIFIRTDPQNPVQGGFEIQLFDSHDKDVIGSHDCGALYDAVVPSKNAVKPFNQWNQIQIRCKGAIIQVTLNGERVVNANLNKWTTAEKNPDGSKNKFKTALKDLPRSGNIGFQDHGHNVSFRNVFLKELK